MDVRILHESTRSPCLEVEFKEDEKAPRAVEKLLLKCEPSRRGDIMKYKVLQVVHTVVGTERMNW